MPDPELALEVVEALHQIVWRAGYDQVVGDLLLVGHGEHVWRTRPQGHALTGAAADARRCEILDRASGGRAHAPLEVAPGLASLLRRVGGDGAQQEAQLVRGHLAAGLGCTLTVVLEELAGDRERHQERDVG